MHPLDSSRSWVSVSLLLPGCDYWAFCASVELVVLFRACVGSSRSAYWKSRFEAFHASSGWFSCLDSLCVLFIDFRFLGFSCIRLHHFPFLDVVLGRRFWSR